MTKEEQLRTIFRFLNEIGIVSQLAGNALSQALGSALTLPQFVVLNHLLRLGGGKTPLALARAMQVTKGAMTNTLKHLDRAGFVSIVADAEDGRSKRIDITAKGRAAHAAALRSIEPELAFLNAQLSISQIEIAMPIVEQVRCVLDDRRYEGK